MDEIVMAMAMKALFDGAGAAQDKAVHVIEQLYLKRAFDSGAISIIPSQAAYEEFITAFNDTLHGVPRGRERHIAEQIVFDTGLSVNVCATDMSVTDDAAALLEKDGDPVDRSDPDTRFIVVLGQYNDRTKVHMDLFMRIGEARQIGTAILRMADYAEAMKRNATEDQ
jgi:hypothetical protein